MATLIRPQLWGTQKPPSGATLAGGHPLAAGLSDFWLLGEAGGRVAQNLAAPAHPAWLQGTAHYGPTGIVLDGTTGGQAATAAYGTALPQYGITLWVRARVATTSEHGPFIMHTGASVNVFNGWGVGVGNGTFDAAGNFLIAVVEGVAWQATAVSLGTGWHTIAYTCALGDQRLWLDGQQVGSFADTPAAPTTSSLTTLGGEQPFGNPWRGPAGTVAAGAVWRRVLSPTALAWLHAEPYAMVAPPAPRLRYFIPTGAAPTTAFRDTPIRFRMAVTNYRDTQVRFKLAATNWKDTQVRFKLAATNWKDTQTRFKLAITNWRDTRVRFRLAATTWRDTQFRFIVLSNIAAVRDTQVRFRLAATNYRDVALRFLLGLVGYRDTPVRFRLALQAWRDTRVRLKVAARTWHDTRFRFAFSTTNAWRDTRFRFRVATTPIVPSITATRADGRSSAPSYTEAA